MFPELDIWDLLDRELEDLTVEDLDRLVSSLHSANQSRLVSSWSSSLLDARRNHFIIVIRGSRLLVVVIETSRWSENLSDFSAKCVKV